MPSSSPVASLSPLSHPLHSSRKPGPLRIVLFIALLLTGLAVTLGGIHNDVSDAQSPPTTWLPFAGLALALVIALGFEFVNGFHDTANAVATVIYTHSLPPNAAVLWSGFCNFLGVLFSSGAVAFSVIALLPVDLVVEMGAGKGFAMIFALLIAAIIWNLGTWWLGLPASSSHTLIGSIIGVGLMHAWLGGMDGSSGVDWGQVAKVGYALLFSPLIGFACAALLLVLLKRIVRDQTLYQEPKSAEPPPPWIRGLLILVGALPTAYALNRAVPATATPAFAAVAEVTASGLRQAAPQAAPADPHGVLLEFVRKRQSNPEVLPALAAITDDIAREVRQYGALNNVPAQSMPNVRNAMYLASESIRLLEKEHLPGLAPKAQEDLKEFKRQIDQATRFIPLWVKVAVAIALGLGTLVGWRRIVITVGERIGKTHLTYAQGASAELVAMGTIGAADAFGLPVSTTHVLSSGVAGTMAANGSGLQWATVRNLALAWVLTLPVAMALSASLYWLLVHLF